MTTDTQTVESICRELAERGRRTEATLADHIYGESTFVLDPRFDALRGEHDIGPQLRPPFPAGCRNCHYPLSPYCLRTDLGSIVRAAMACGLETRVHENRQVTMFRYAEPRYLGGAQSWGTESDSPELAAARALKEAVNASV